MEDGAQVTQENVSLIYLFRVEASCPLLLELSQGLFIVCSFNRRYNLSHESGVVLPAGMDSFRGSNNIISVVPFQLLQVMCCIVARHPGAEPGERHPVAHAQPLSLA